MGESRAGTRNRCLVFLAPKLLLLLLVASACGNYSRIGRFEDPVYDVPVEIALKSTVLGATSFRMARDIGVICVGRVLRANVVREADEESARARIAWEERITTLVRGAAPTVVPANRCILDEENRVRLRSSGAPALAVTVSPSPILDGYVEISVGGSPGRGQAFPSGGMWYRLVQDADGWWMNDFRCRGGIFCDEFDFAQILDGIERGGDPDIGG